MTALPRICILTETYHPVIGGGEVQARALADGLVAKGFEVMVVTRRSDASFERTERYGEVTVYRLSPTGHQHLRKWGLLLTSFIALIRLRRRYDLIFVSGYRVVGIAAVLVSRLFGKACVLKADSLGEMSGEFFTGGLASMGLTPTSLPVRAFLSTRNWLLRHADAFVAICSDTVHELKAHGVNPETIHQITNSVDTQTFRPVDEQTSRELRDKLGLRCDHLIVTYTGRLVSYKGLPLLLQVWTELESEPREITLVLLGSGGLDIHNCEAELRTYVASHNLHESVRFAGDVRNVHEYLQASDIFAYPTENDAFPLALIEAMACALPVMSTPVGAIKEIITHMQNGLMVDVGDVQQTLDALEALMADTTLRARLGAAARHTVEDRYAAERVTHQYATLFTGLATRSRGTLPQREKVS
jgi:glycosyltransferase involved in cell wall biosynthesis